jgi:hypothetical protein
MSIHFAFLFCTGRGLCNGPILRPGSPTECVCIECDQMQQQPFTPIISR